MGTILKTRIKETINSLIGKENVPYKKAIINDLVSLNIYPIPTDCEIIKSSFDDMKTFLTSETSNGWNGNKYFNIFYKKSKGKLNNFCSLYIVEKNANTVFPVVTVCIDKDLKLWIYIASPYNQKKKNKYVSVSDAYYEKKILSVLNNSYFKYEINELLVETRKFVKEINFQEKELKLEKIEEVANKMRRLNMNEHCDKCYKTRAFHNDEEENVAIIGYDSNGKIKTHLFFGIPCICTWDFVDINKPIAIVTFGLLEGGIWKFTY